jgi:hypothetical protein
MEEVLPPQTESGAGFEPTRVRQITVFLDNRVGRLQTLVRAYEEAGGRIMSLSIQNSADTALVRLICSEADLARDALGKHGFAFAEQDVLIVQVPPRHSQPLVAICSVLVSAEINILYAYPLLIGPKGPALALYVDDLTLAAQLLIRKGFTLIGESDLRGGGT